jgi:hypothetical protein
MYVVRTEFTPQTQASSPAPEEAVLSLVLESLETPDSLVHFDKFASKDTARAMCGEVYRLLIETTGPWATAPRCAVYAMWQVANREYEDAFVESRRRLFEIRRRVLPTFAYDWLLRRLDQEGRYLVLGLYGDEEGATRLCREHPEIKRFVQANPASMYTASDLSGLCCFRVERITSPTVTG